MISKPAITDLCPMAKKLVSMTCRTASGGSGNFSGRWGQSDQEIAERVHILDGSYNAGAHHSPHLNASRFKQRTGFWALMRKGQCHNIASERHVETSETERFWHIIRVYCLRLLRLVRQSRWSHDLFQDRLF